MAKRAYSERAIPIKVENVNYRVPVKHMQARNLPPGPEPVYIDDVVAVERKDGTYARVKPYRGILVLDGEPNVRAHPDLVAEVDRGTEGRRDRSGLKRRVAALASFIALAGAIAMFTSNLTGYAVLGAGEMTKNLIGGALILVALILFILFMKFSKNKEKEKSVKVKKKVKKK
ncbi:MAG: hypothetical protein WCK90_01550 [archaeon]